MYINLGFLCSSINSLLMSGNPPAEIHVNRSTYDDICTAIVEAEMPHPARWRRIAAALFSKPLLAAWRLNGVPLVVNGSVPLGGVCIRPASSMSDDHWLDALLGHTGQPTPPEAARAQAMSLPETGGIQELVKDEPRTVTDILIQAATDCDDVRTVLVITVRPNGEVKLMGNGTKFEVFGVLHAALTKIACGE